MFLTNGVGRHKDYLHSFELALRDAGIEKCNLVSVSSILPPKCKIVSKEQGLKLLKPGQITYCVMARNATNEPYRSIVSSIGMAIPADSDQYGYISEHHTFGQSGDAAGDYAEDMAASMLASTLGIEFDSDKDWDEREQLFKLSGKIVKARNVTQSALGDKNGIWTTVVAAVVFVLETEAEADQSNACRSEGTGKGSIRSCPVRRPNNGARSERKASCMTEMDEPHTTSLTLLCDKRLSQEA